MRFSDPSWQEGFYFLVQPSVPKRGSCSGEKGIPWRRRALQSACPAVPAFVGIVNDRSLYSVRPVKDISGAYLVAVSTLDTFVINQRGHPFLRSRPLKNAHLSRVSRDFPHPSSLRRESVQGYSCIAPTGLLKGDPILLGLVGDRFRTPWSSSHLLESLTPDRTSLHYPFQDSLLYNDRE